MKVEATEVEGRKVYSVRAFNHGVAGYIEKLPTVWVEGEVTELRRQERWASVFLTLKDPEDGACLAVQMPRGQFDGLRLELQNGERVHVYGRPELYAQRGDFHLRALTMRATGSALTSQTSERLKQKLAAEGLPAVARKRALPRIPALIGLVTGNDAAAKRDVLTAITTRFPPAHVLVAETYVQGPRAAPAIATAIADLCARGVDVLILARGGGSFEDLLPFSDERVVRAVAECPVPVVSAVGHEQDTPLCDLAADVRASTPSVAGRLVVPDLAALRAWLDRAHAGSVAAHAGSSSGTVNGLARPTTAFAVHPLALSAPPRAGRYDPRQVGRALSPSEPRTRLRNRPQRRSARRRTTRTRDRAGGRGRGRRVWSAVGMTEQTFEQAQVELEQIVERLERGDVGLEELMKLWERGEELYRRCAEQLAGAQGTIEELARRLDAQQT